MNNEFRCKNCRKIMKLQDMRYDPYRKIRYCEECYKFAYPEHRIYRTAEIKVKSLEEVINETKKANIEII